MMQSQERSCIDKEWALPILGIVGSMSLIVAIGILLGHFNNKPVFDWHGVTLNAIVSILTTILKALLAFTLDECLGQAKWIWFSRQQQPLNDLNLIDQASRGPLGCCKILRRSIARSFISIGAITVVLSTAMDPFFQLTIGKRGDVSYGESSNAKISYAKRYSKGSFYTVAATVIGALDGNNYTMTETDADFGMKSAVLSGLSLPKSDILQQTQHLCPVGNCTWDTFRSLAVCSACNDLTNRIVSKDIGLTHPLAFILDTTNAGMVVEQMTEYRLPNGLTGDNSSLMTAFGTSNATESLSFASHDTLIWSMTMINVTSNGQPFSRHARPVNVSATECGLWYCVNAYSSAIKNGNLTEIVRPGPSKRNVDSWRPTGNFYRNEIATPPPNMINYYGNNSSSVERTDLQLDEGFNISQAAIYSISKLISDTFVGNSHRGAINAYVTTTGKNLVYTPTAMQSLYKSADLEVTFASLAKSMTNNLRQNDDNGSVITGQEGTYLLLIRVRFWFLTLPAMVTSVSAGFLALVIYYTHTSDLEVWTTNALPVVALGRTSLKSSSSFVFDSTENMATEVMERKAKQEMVQFAGSRKPAELLRQLHNSDESKRFSFRQHGGYEQISD